MNNNRHPYLGIALRAQLTTPAHEDGAVEIDQQSPGSRILIGVAQHHVVVADVAMEDMPEFVQTIMGYDRSE